MSGIADPVEVVIPIFVFTATIIFPSGFIAPARAVHITAPMSVVNAPNTLSIRESMNVELCRIRPVRKASAVESEPMNIKAKPAEDVILLRPTIPTGVFS